MLASLRTKHKDELKKALDAQDFQAAHEMKEKFTREEALLQEYDAEIKKLVEAKNDEGAAAKRKELMSKMSTAQHSTSLSQFRIRLPEYKNRRHDSTTSAEKWVISMMLTAC